ncbi:unnamed protein product, partial [Haemonchus placei]|uniref:Glycosyltransferase n=1 Tax=Haemonchus placei TaxID=6290 RepID=A0A0N4X646_HAEPC
MSASTLVIPVIPDETRTARAISEKTCEDTTILSYLPLSYLEASKEVRTSFCCCCSHRSVIENQQASEM